MMIAAKLIFLVLVFYILMVNTRSVDQKQETKQIEKKQHTLTCNEPWLQAADVEPCLEVKYGYWKKTSRCEGDMIDPSEPCRDDTDSSNEPNSIIINNVDKFIEGTVKESTSKNQKKTIDKQQYQILKFHNRVRRVAKHYLAWPKNKDGFTYIPYEFITPVTDIHNVVREAINDFHRQTCIRFIPKKEKDINYIQVTHHNIGCFSHQGMVGGAQRLNLQVFSPCVTKGIAIHEMMHALGFYHTMSRRDRDEYITINYQNILKDEFDQFTRHHHGNGSVFGEIYDTQSIMHYGNYAFAINKRIKTIISKNNPDEILGQREKLSQSDVIQINRMYHCYKYLNLDKDMKL